VNTAATYTQNPVRRYNVVSMVLIKGKIETWTLVFDPQAPIEDTLKTFKNNIKLCKHSIAFIFHDGHYEMLNTNILSTFKEIFTNVEIAGH
jgi:hypothetical protein